MNIEKRTNLLLFTPYSKIDGTNAEYVYKTIKKTIQESGIFNYIIDLSEVEYVSSLGLRNVLLLAKEAVENGSILIIIGAVESVKKIMDSTGITKIIKFEKNEINAIEYINKIKLNRP